MKGENRIINLVDTQKHQKNSAFICDKNSRQIDTERTHLHNNKAIYEKLVANMIKWGKKTVCSQNPVTEQVCLFLPLLSNIGLEVLDKAIR